MGIDPFDPRNAFAQVFPPADGARAVPTQVNGFVLAHFARAGVASQFARCDAGCTRAVASGATQLQDRGERV